MGTAAATKVARAMESKCRRIFRQLLVSIVKASGIAMRQHRHAPARLFHCSCCWQLEHSDVAGSQSTISPLSC